jgi:hypothetical protein
VFVYTAYNLCIHSQIPFSELVSSEAIPEGIEKLKLPDVVISLRQISDLEAESANGENRFFGIIEDGTVCRFLVEFGQQIVVEPAPGIEEDILHPFILGPIFAILLRQRGLLVLHASCVVIDHAAVAFLGYSGWGKSTLANAFYNQGYSLLTDDVMAIKVGGNELITFPGYPYVRLLPDSAASLGYEFEKLAFIHTGALKRNNLLTQGFPQTPLPLKRIYVLENIRRSHNEIEPIQSQEAFLALLRHSRVTNVLTNEHFVSSHFHQCAELIEKVPMSLLKRQYSLDALPDLVQLVEQDFGKGADIRPCTTKTPVLGR